MLPGRKVFLVNVVGPQIFLVNVAVGKRFAYEIWKTFHFDGQPFSPPPFRWPALCPPFPSPICPFPPAASSSKVVSSWINLHMFSHSYVKPPPPLLARLDVRTAAVSRVPAGRFFMAAGSASSPPRRAPALALGQCYKAVFLLRN